MVRSCGLGEGVGTVLMYTGCPVPNQGGSLPLSRLRIYAQLGGREGAFVRDTMPNWESAEVERA